MSIQRKMIVSSSVNAESRLSRMCCGFERAVATRYDPFNKSTVSLLSPAGSRELDVLLGKVRRPTDCGFFHLDLPW